MSAFNDYIAAANGLIFVATAEDEQPSLRIMSFAADPKTPNHWYLVSQPDATKVGQIDHNDKVAIMTPLDEQGRRIESNRATMRRSDKSWSEVADFFADFPTFFKVHTHPENEVLFEITLDSVRLASYSGEDSVTF